MVHSAGIRGYVFTYLFSLIAIMLFSSYAWSFVTSLDLTLNPRIFIAIRVILMCLVSFAVANQFMAIEERPPTPHERDLITTYSFSCGTLIVSFGLGITFFIFLDTRTVSDYNILRTALDSAVTLSVTIYLSLYLNLGTFAKKRFERAQKHRF